MSVLARQHVFGLDLVDAESVRPVIDELLAVAPADLPEPSLPVVVTPNVDHLVRLDAGEDAVAGAIAATAAWVLPDGQPLIWASRLLRRPLRARLAGSNVVGGLWPRLLETDRRALVVASSTEVAGRVEADGASAVVAPMVSLVDRTALDSLVDECVARIDAEAPEFVFVTLGFPKQCNVIDGIVRGLRAKGRPLPLLLAVGASFDMHYGLVRRAPSWMQRSGLEWFFRFVQEPRRLFRRYFVDDPAFVRIVWREWRGQSPRRCQERRRFDA